MEAPIAATRTYIPAGRTFSPDCREGAREATVLVKLCSIEKALSSDEFAASSTLVAWEWRERRALRIWVASRSVGERDVGAGLDGRVGVVGWLVGVGSS